LFWLCKTNKCTVEDLLPKIKMLVQGDDNLLVYHHSLKRPDFNNGFLKLGFAAESKQHTLLSDAEFCSSRIYGESPDVSFGPKPGRVLSKFGYVNNPPVGYVREELLRGIALGLWPQCHFIPPLRTLLEKVLESTKHYKPKFLRSFNEHMFKYKTSCTIIDPTISLLDHYGWTVVEQERFENQLCGMQYSDRMDETVAIVLMDADSNSKYSLLN